MCFELWLDILLIFGVLVIVDWEDVVLVVIVELGGYIVYYGMFVDLGNLLLLVELDGVLVVGLLGCV